MSSELKNQSSLDDNSLKTISLEFIKQQKTSDLTKLALDLGVHNPTRMTRQELVFEILKKYVESEVVKIEGNGILELNENGFGFLRGPECSYLSGPDDIYVSPNQIRRFNLRTGDNIKGEIRPPKESERYFALLKVSEINGEDPSASSEKTLFENLVPVYADEQLVLERANCHNELNTTPRIIDFITPIGKGQRGLIVAPPKAGKTELLKSISISIRENYPECELIVLLIDERPEEVTELSRLINESNKKYRNSNSKKFALAEVVASTFDEPASRHIQVAEMVIERAKRQVEYKKDVIILLDSITRLARAYNNETKASGKILSGGIDAAALHKPKKFFGAARNIEGSHQGSLTIIATALIETGSKMDDVIFEEFKGTGNMELVLSRAIAERRIFPAIDIVKSSTRREEKLLAPEIVAISHKLRSNFSDMKNEIEVINFMLNRIRSTLDNESMIQSLDKNDYDNEYSN